ncbi:MAG: hypothetical protein GX033_08885 [Firmicutes bacterium]|nr:hypothetical protein [Bacillota bacterium]
MLPLLLLIAAGALARVSLQIEAKPLARLTLYLLSPALIFNSLYHSQLTGPQLGQLAGGTLLLIVTLSLVLTLLCRLLRFPLPLASAMQLGAVFMNVGSYSLPIIAAACGTEGLERGAVIMVVHQMLMFTLAIFFAARGTLGPQRALSKVLQMPTAYAALAALILRTLGYPLPGWLAQGISLLCQACIPIFLLLLGIQLADMLFSQRWFLLTLGTCFKLGFAPVAANFLARLLHFDSLSQQVFVLAAASPTAVVTTMLAVEFDAEPELVSSLTLVTTLLSLFSIPLIMQLLGLG